MQNIYDLLNVEYPWEYDMKEIKFRGENSVDNTLKYKYLNKIWDCDGSGEGESFSTNSIIREIYRLLWGWDDITIYNEKEYIKRYAPIKELYEGLLFQPETMTSFLTTFKVIISNEKMLREKYVCNSKYFYYKDNPKEEIDIEAVRQFVVDSKNMKELELFCSNVGKIGNMTLTLAGYNIYTCCDYWDLKINKQYLNNNMHSEKFKQEYINKFLMWDYVDYNNDKYVMKMFYNNHDKHIMPINFDDILMILNSVNSYINRRGFLMTLLLLLKQNNSEQYNKLKLKISNNEVHTMNDAINMVLSIYGLEKDNELLMTFEDNTIHEVYNEFKQKLCNEMQ